MVEGVTTGFCSQLMFEGQGNDVSKEAGIQKASRFLSTSSLPGYKQSSARYDGVHKS